jgi:Condensation domain
MADRGQSFGLSDDFVAYPVTPLQSGMILATMNDSSAYVLQQVYSAEHGVDVQRLERAFRDVLTMRELLRTSFVTTSEGLCQVVGGSIERVFVAQVSSSISAFLEEDRRLGFSLDSQFWIRLSVVSDQPMQYLVVTIHHALYDGWSLPFIVEDIFKSYEGQALEHRPSFHTVVNYIESRDKDAVQQYWSEYLGGMPAADTFSFVNEASQDGPGAPINMKCSVSSKDLNDTARKLGVTVATLLKTAWAFTLRKYQRSSDVVFGFVTAGRDIPVQDVDR